MLYYSVLDSAVGKYYAKKSHDTDSNTSDNSEGNTDEKNGYTKKHKKDKYYNKNPYDRMKETKKKNKRR